MVDPTARPLSSAKPVDTAADVAADTRKPFHVVNKQIGLLIKYGMVEEYGWGGRGPYYLAARFEDDEDDEDVEGPPSRPAPEPSPRPEETHR